LLKNHEQIQVDVLEPQFGSILFTYVISTIEDLL